MSALVPAILVQKGRKSLDCPSSALKQVQSANQTLPTCIMNHGRHMPSDDPYYTLGVSQKWLWWRQVLVERKEQPVGNLEIKESKEFLKRAYLCPYLFPIASRCPCLYCLVPQSSWPHCVMFWLFTLFWPYIVDCGVVVRWWCCLNHVCSCLFLINTFF